MPKTQPYEGRFTAKTGTPVLRRLAAVSPYNDTLAADDCPTPAVSTASAVGPSAASAAPSDNRAFALDYGAAAAPSASSVSFRFLIPFAEKIFRCSQPVKERLHKCNECLKSHSMFPKLLGHGYWNHDRRMQGARNIGLYQNSRLMHEAPAVKNQLLFSA